MYRQKHLACLAKLAIEKNQDIVKAIQYQEQAVKILPTNLHAIFNLALYLHVAGQTQQSVNLLENTLKSPMFQDYRKGLIVQELNRYRSELNKISDTK